jgi:Spy/CpxP family protein refolding chaperone
MTKFNVFAVLFAATVASASVSAFAADVPGTPVVAAPHDAKMKHHVKHHHHHSKHHHLKHHRDAK